jgi:hypothetical protein
VIDWGFRHSIASNDLHPTFLISSSDSADNGIAVTGLIQMCSATAVMLWPRRYFMYLHSQQLLMLPSP